MQYMNDQQGNLHRMNSNLGGNFWGNSNIEVIPKVAPFQ